MEIRRVVTHLGLQYAVDLIFARTHKQQVTVIVFPLHTQNFRKPHKQAFGTTGMLERR